MSLFPARDNRTRALQRSRGSLQVAAIVQPPSPRLVSSKVHDVWPALAPEVRRTTGKVTQLSESTAQAPAKEACLADPPKRETRVSASQTVLGGSLLASLKALSA